MQLTNPDKLYIAVIGDIRASRKIEQRQGLQVRLKEALAIINENYGQDLASRFTVTLGDEFQGLLKHGKSLVKIVGELERSLYPVQLRFGIGVGGMTTDIDYELAIGADGPAYHRARAAISFLKDNEKRSAVGKKELWLLADEEEPEMVRLINTTFSLLTVIKNNWTERQREAIWDMEQHGEGQTEAASRLGIKQSSVQKHLARGHYYSYREALVSLEEALGKLGRKDV